MKHTFMFFFLYIMLAVNTKAQDIKLGVARLTFIEMRVHIDGDDNWQGYHLNERQNAYELSVIRPLLKIQHLHVGGGLAYLNFEGVHGLSMLTDLDLHPFSGKIIPFLNLRAGYNHLWNQYENGTGSALLEANLGLKYHLDQQRALWICAGIHSVQNAYLFPVRLGVSL